MKNIEIAQWQRKDSTLSLLVFNSVMCPNLSFAYLAPLFGFRATQGPCPAVRDQVDSKVHSQQIEVLSETVQWDKPRKICKISLKLGFKCAAL